MDGKRPKLDNDSFAGKQQQQQNNNTSKMKILKMYHGQARDGGMVSNDKTRIDCLKIGLKW